MDIGDSSSDHGDSKPRDLPSDLPKSLNDRKHVPVDLVPETEMYDGWQGASLRTTPPTPAAPITDAQCIGESQFLTSPALAKPLNFGNLSLNDTDYDDVTKAPADSDARLMEMLAAQAAHLSTQDVEDEQAIIKDEKLSDEEKRSMLQKALNMAASNGDVEKVQRLLDGDVKTYVDVDASDEDGTPPLIYASCFVCLMKYLRKPQVC